MAKSSPLKGADPVLVEWAYRAAGDELYQKYVQQHHDNMMRIADELRSWDFGTGAQRIIDANGRLPQGEINGIRDQLSGPMKEEYITGDNKKKEEITNEVAKMHQDMSQYGTLRQSIANNYKGDNFSKGWLRTPQAQETLELMKDEVRLTKKKCPEGQDDCDDKGSLGVMMTDHKVIAAANKRKNDLQIEINNMEKLWQTGAVYDDTALDQLYDQLRETEEFIKSNPKKWTSISEIQSGITMVDQGAIDLIGAARNASFQKGKDLLPEDNASFNREQASLMVDDVIMKSSNMMSLVYDPMFGENSFYDNLVEHIQGNTYAQFGINDAMVWQEGDLDQNNEIDEKEAQLIAQAFIGTELDKNKDLKREMNRYLVNHLEKNYELGKKSRRDSYLEDDKPTSDFDAQGNYVPQTQRQQEIAKEVTGEDNKPASNEDAYKGERYWNKPSEEYDGDYKGQRYYWPEENVDIIENEDIDEDDDDDVSTE